MLTRKWWRSLACFVLLVGAAPFVVLWLWPERDYDRECFEQIRFGKQTGNHDLLTHYGFKPTRGDVGIDIYMKYEREGSGVSIELVGDRREGLYSKTMTRGVRVGGGSLERLQRLFTRFFTGR